MRTVSLAFFAIAVAFLGIGISGNRTFLILAMPFLVLAIVQLSRNARR